jgi:superfamily I DNA and/or RNA helicase
MASQTYEQIVENMSLAVTASIEYLKKQGDSQIIVRNGKLISPQGDVFLYEFTSDKLQLIEEDADVEVRIGDNSANGKIAAVAEGMVQIETDTNLGASVPEARLIISSYFLLEQLNEKLVALGSGEAKHSKLAEKLFDIAPTTTALDNDYKFPLAKFSLNEYQEKAVRLALGSDVSFIWGPPGTGKTFVIARLVEALLSKNYSVLLISHTNAATDGALLEVVNHLEKSEDYLDGKLLREGRIVNNVLAEKLVTVEKIMEKKAKPILDEIKVTTSEMESDLAKLSAHRSAEFMLGKIQSSIDEHANLKEYVIQLESQVYALREDIKGYESNFADTEQRIAEFQQLGSFKKLLSGTNLEKLTSEKASRRNTLESAKNQVLQIRKDYTESTYRLRALESHIADEKSKLSKEGLLSDSQAETLAKNVKIMEDAIKALKAELEALNDNLILEAKLIATTLTKSYQSKKILSREYDCVIVDEASMAPLPTLLTSAGIAKAKITLVGDFFQLPPIAKYRSDEDDEETAQKQNAVDAWLRRDIFAATGITEAIKSGKGQPVRMQQLRIQRRMHPDISEIVNKLVYAKYGDYSLKNDSVTYDYGVDKLSSQPLPDSHLGIYDTTNLGTLPSKTDSGSIYNVPQALVCVELAKQALKNGYEKVGIVSAYRAQVNLLQKIIGDSMSQKDSEKVLADTVHKFQGGEKELIIFDVTTPRTRTMYDDGEVDGDDEKLINVAFSRAKAKLLLVGDIKKIEKAHDHTSLIKQTIEHVRATDRPILDASNLISPLDLSEKTDSVLASLNGASLEKAIQSGGLLDENDFYKAFFQDLIHAEQEVIIISPFLSTRRYEQLETIFNNLRLRGVQIFVITRPSEEHDGNLREMSEKVIRSMEKMGITVLPIRGYTHEKVAVIDRKILYVGSLNILSQRESHEIMHRIGGKKGLVAKQYMQFLKLDKNIGEIGQSKLKHCEVCTEPGSWYWTAKSRFGMWTFCLTGMHSPNKPPKPKRTKQDRVDERTKKRNVINLDANGIPICPVHGIKTVIKKGYWGEFYGCPKYKECDYAVPLKKVEKLRGK